MKCNKTRRNENDFIYKRLCKKKIKDRQDCTRAFGTLNRKQPDANSIDKAMGFLKDADFFERLASQEERDKAFRDNVVKSYSVMLDNLEEVRNHLLHVMSEEPYDWFGLPTVDKKLKEMAEFKYNQSGCEKALEKIDDMDAADVKQYLKRLIKDNMIVGMEIIKGKRGGERYGS